MPTHHASCHCGAVRYQVDADPVDAKLFHCRTCQALHGAPMQWAAIFHKHDVRFLAGETQLRFYNSGLRRFEHILPCKVSCAACGTPIADDGRNMWLAFPTLFDFGTPPRVPSGASGKFGNLRPHGARQVKAGSAARIRYTGKGPNAGLARPVRPLRARAARAGGGGLAVGGGVATDREGHAQVTEFAACSTKAFRPSCHIFYDSRVMDVDDALPKWSGHKGESLLL